MIYTSYFSPKMQALAVDFVLFKLTRKQKQA